MKKPKKQKLDEEGLPICEDCGNTLPKAVMEDRGGGYSELVTYCKCGAIYTE